MTDYERYDRLRDALAATATVPKAAAGANAVRGPNAGEYPTGSPITGAWSAAASC